MANIKVVCDTSDLPYTVCHEETTIEVYGDFIVLPKGWGYIEIQQDGFVKREESGKIIRFYCPKHIRIDYVSEIERLRNKIAKIEKFLREGLEEVN